mmetsp:Transcript_83580/g.241401  ORF Transcript_83580/g.241401 Transcript_83580/m.241401 type:complete len:228 (-) Transcript_83580:135-818(-)
MSWRSPSGPRSSSAANIPSSAPSYLLGLSSCAVRARTTLSHNHTQASSCCEPQAFETNARSEANITDLKSAKTKGPLLFEIFMASTSHSSWNRGASAKQPTSVLKAANTSRIHGWGGRRMTVKLNRNMSSNVIGATTRPAAPLPLLALPLEGDLTDRGVALDPPALVVASDRGVDVSEVLLCRCLSSHADESEGSLQTPLSPSVSLDPMWPWFASAQLETMTSMRSA